VKDIMTYPMEIRIKGFN